MDHEPLFDMEQTGVQLFFHTNKNTNTSRSHPVHWHPMIELVYVLNGSGRILLDGKPCSLVPGEFIVIDSDQLHECWYKRDAMLVVIQFSRKVLKNFAPEVERYSFQCAKGTLKPEQLEPYLRICDMLKTLPPLCIMPPTGYRVKSYAVVMDIFFELLNHFASDRGLLKRTDQEEILKRLEEITTYIEEHHAEQISLQDISSHFYLSREYFSRFFKKNMGVSFLRYLNEVRLVHIYQDICSMTIGIMEAAELHGFTNYKLFNKMFHEVYGCTPREVRIRRIEAAAEL